MSLEVERKRINDIFESNDCNIRLLSDEELSTYKMILEADLKETNLSEEDVRRIEAAFDEETAYNMLEDYVFYEDQLRLVNIEMDTRNI